MRRRFRLGGGGSCRKFVPSVRTPRDPDRYEPVVEHEFGALADALLAIGEQSSIGSARAERPTRSRALLRFVRDFEAAVTEPPMLGEELVKRASSQACRIVAAIDGESSG
jgi:hypothetical protein